MEHGIRPTGSRARAWLELLRVPNLFTVPGDPVAGFMLTGAACQVIWMEKAFCALGECILTSLFLYAAGLVTNDLFDFKEDLRDRAARPLTSGRVGRLSAGLVAGVFFAAGIASAFYAGQPTGILAVVLAAAILAYNAAVKRIPVVGPLNMGLCRGLSSALGASVFGFKAFQSPFVIAAAGGLTLYVMFVTLIAAKETTGRAPGWLAILPAVILLPWLVSLELVGGNDVMATVTLAPALAAAAIACKTGIDIWNQRKPAAVSKAIGTFLRLLILAQASICLTASKPPDTALFAGIALILLWPASTWLGRKFYAS